MIIIIIIIVHSKSADITVAQQSIFKISESFPKIVCDGIRFQKINNLERFTHLSKLPFSIISIYHSLPRFKCNSNSLLTENY